MKRGFTLVEMLTVIIILSLIGLIGIVSVESIIKRGTEKAYQAQMSEIKTAAENLVKVEGLPSWCKTDTCFITLRYLAYNNYIKLKDVDYVVVSGDTINTIAAKFNITADELVEYNNITSVTEGKTIKIPSSKSYGEYTNPKTDESFSLETVVMVKTIGNNYTFEAFESLDALNEQYSSNLAKANKDAVSASAIIYKKMGFCADENNCSLRTTSLVNKNLLEANFYADVDITIDSEDEITIG